MRIPTLLALTLLTIIIILGIGIAYYRQQIQDKEKQALSPFDIKVANITHSSATITWQTKIPTSGQVIFRNNINFLKNSRNDDRDLLLPKPHLIHFVTLKGLIPNTKYDFQVQNQDSSFPDQPLEFKTAEQESNTSTPLNSPIRGTILDSNLKPVDEALVFLKIDGAAELAAFTATAGNFLLSLDLKTSDLKSPFTLTNSTPGTLVIKRGSLSSQIKIILPLNNQSLPPIILGKDVDLTQLITSFQNLPPKSEKLNLKPQRNPNNKFDLNNDGRVNAVDLSIALDILIRNPKDKMADFNSDGKVDQKDINLIESALQ